ncbi:MULTISPECIES: 7-carboxy-7-deazaguanine synthase QueE [Zhongshania]|jgi:7-carboxy-7-deazaguanine synthase|uniref:7-carboxy-7-deazaguanine synthase n=1 Tax=Zhongshania aquimaris TaxID=2857107 RepID=A0ABS6VVM3_9GAMM|nr:MULTISPECIES: 7-carboxy-7-deazaguanine synthase QueE [Zhongshania]MBQ0796062.1 7-carboxy-7-deazaguanine synthase QueE [Zhongshania sp.]MBW2942372.1 7-carboxy-7-deazaguanine synthase QueE [Zhongshania aquimaris]
MNANTLRITEIFYSLQGESRTLGLPTVFVRLTGCPLRCVYCDTEYAFHGGERRQIEDILATVASYKPRYVCVTGGEPLAQPECHTLLTALCDAGYEVSIETSGALSVEHVDSRVSKVMDLKTPASGEMHRNLMENIAHIGRHDQIKFVLCNREDYDWARFQLDSQNLADKAGEVLFSPSFGQLSATDLADWIVEDNLPVRFQMQLHKLLWNDAAGH